MNLEQATKVLELFGYPVAKTRWVTWGGGYVQEFDTDEELIEFAEGMKDRIDRFNLPDDPIIKRVNEVLEEDK